MIPWFPTADPISARHGFYKHFGDAIFLLNDKKRPRAASIQPMQPAGGASLSGASAGLGVGAGLASQAPPAAANNPHPPVTGWEPEVVVSATETEESEAAGPSRGAASQPRRETERGPLVVGAAPGESTEQSPAEGKGGDEADGSLVVPSLGKAPGKASPLFPPLSPSSPLALLLLAHVLCPALCLPLTTLFVVAAQGPTAGR